MNAPIVPISTPAAVTTVLIVDDQTLQRTGIRLLLDGEPDIRVAAEASTPPQAAFMARTLGPDVVLMHLRTPHDESIHAVRAITTSVRTTNVLVATAFAPGNFAYAALSAGARGVLVQAGGAELLAGIRAIRTGGAVLSPSLTRRVIDIWFREPRAVVPDDPGDREALREQLTGRELQVLALLARGRSNAEMAATLRVSLTTVKTHIQHILTKLRLHSRLQAVAFAYEHGVVAARTA